MVQSRGEGAGPLLAAPSPTLPGSLPGVVSIHLAGLR